MGLATRPEQRGGDSEGRRLDFSRLSWGPEGCVAHLGGEPTRRLTVSNLITIGVCQRCKGDTAAESCTGYSLNIEGAEYFRVRFGSERGRLHLIGGRCRDCNVTHGSLHHMHCEVEECPKCGGHLLACDCVPLTSSV